MTDELVDIDALTEQLSLQDWRAARGGMYKALRELATARVEVQRLQACIDGVRAVLDEGSSLDPDATVGRVLELIDG